MGSTLTMLALAGGSVCALAAAFAVVLGPVTVLPSLMARYRHQRLAQQLGLDMRFARQGWDLVPSAKGEHQGRMMSFGREEVADGPRVGVTSLRLSCALRGLDVVIAPRNAIHSSAKGSRWSSGDADFDSALIVRCNQPVRWANILTEELRESLRAWGASAPEAAWIELRGEGLAHFDPTRVVSHEDYQRQLSVVALFERLAARVEEVAG